MMPTSMNRQQNILMINMKEALIKIKKTCELSEIEAKLHKLGHDPSLAIHCFGDDRAFMRFLELNEEEYKKIFGNFRWRH